MFIPTTLRHATADRTALHFSRNGFGISGNKNKYYNRPSPFIKNADKKGEYQNNAERRSEFVIDTHPVTPEFTAGRMAHFQL